MISFKVICLSMVIHIVFLASSSHIENVNKCSDITDCFNCSSSKESQSSSCIWTANTGCESVNYLAEYPKWYEYYSVCEKDANGMTASSTHCQLTETTALPLLAELNKINEKYGIKNLYCFWSISADPGKTIFVNFTKPNQNEDDFFALELKTKDDSFQISYFETPTHTASASSIKQLTFRYLMKSSKTQLPFTLSIVYEKQTLETYIIILIVIGSLISLFIIFCIIFWYCGRSKLKKNKERQSTIGANGHHVINNETNRVPNHQDYNLEEITCKKNKAQLEYMFFSNYMISQKDLTLNEKGLKCTICQEEFMEKDYISKLICTHIFHSKCFQDWMDQNKNIQLTCPNCNKVLVTEQLDNKLQTINSPIQIISTRRVPRGITENEYPSQSNRNRSRIDNGTNSRILNNDQDNIHIQRSNENNIIINRNTINNDIPIIDPIAQYNRNVLND